MSERLNICPECRSKHINLIEILNPETLSMNADASLCCMDCKYQWQGKVTSPLYLKKRIKGRIR